MSDENMSDELAELTHDLRVHQAELEQQAHELRESNVRLELAGRRFRNLFEALPQSAVVTDRFGNVLSANREAERLLGVHSDQYRREMLPLLGSSDAAVSRLRGAFVVAGRQGAAQEREVELSGAGAVPLLVDVEIVRLEPAEEIEPDGGERFIVLLPDKTARRADQDQLRLLATAVATIEDLVVITDVGPLDEVDPKIIFVNDAFERVTGFSREEAIGRSPRMLQGPGTDRGELDRIRAALELQQSVTAEVLNYARDGRPYWLELSIVPIFDRDGVCTNFVAVQRDVSDRRRAEERSQQVQRLEALGQLTGGVAHDFNNLLSVILGYADELAGDGALDHEQRRLAEIIRSTAERGADLTSRLLSFGRMQALKPSSVDVNECLTSLVDSMLQRTLGEHIDIELDLAPDMQRAAIDQGQFENALVNLAVNARDAAGDGGLLLIRTSMLDVADDAAETLGIDTGRYAMVQVIDDGDGIVATALGQVFDPFFTTKLNGEGTGLGLAMVYGFAKQSNGAVSIESSPGKGTTITMLLPLADAALIVEQPEPERSDTQSHDMLVLLVEDDAMVRTLARSQLIFLGYRVVEAGDASEALALLAAEPEIALLFTDVLLPGTMNGKALADAAHRERADLPVLFTSGFTKQALSIDGRVAPGVHLLEKPYRRADLADALAAVLAASDPPAM